MSFQGLNSKTQIDCSTAPVESYGFRSLGRPKGKGVTQAQIMWPESLPNASYRRDAPENRRRNCMVKKKTGKTTEEFDRRFDDGEDTHDLIEWL